MFKPLIFISLFLPATLFAQVDYRKQFNDQIEQSCTSTLNYQKKFKQGAQTDWQTKVFQLDCEKDEAVQKGTDKKITFVFSREFIYAMEVVYNDPYQEDYFSIESSDTEIFARRKAENEDDTPLKFQRIKFHPQSGKIAQVETQMFKDNWLYDLEVNITVRFDAQGKYLSHELKTVNDVIFSESSATEIEGKSLGK